MKARHFPWRCAAIATTVVWVWSLSIQAADVVTRSGKTLKNVVFLMADSEAVMIKHDGSVIEKWPLADMPDEVQKAYNYDPVAAATVKKDREIAALKKQLADAQKNAAANTTPVVPAISMPAPTPAGDEGLETGGLVSLDKIAADFNANRAAAESKYRGRRFKIKGMIDRIEKDMTPNIFNIFLKSTDGRTRFKLVTEFDSSYNIKRNKVGYSQTDFKIDLVDGKTIGVQKTATIKSGYYYDYYYYYGTRRTIDKDKSPFAPILTAGDAITATATCGGKSVSIDFTNCKFEGLQLPFLTR